MSTRRASPSECWIGFETMEELDEDDGFRRGRFERDFP